MNVKLVDRLQSGNVADYFQLVFVLDGTHLWEKSHWPRKRSFDLGRIIGGRDVIETLSRTKLNERNDFTITIDYRQLI